MADALKPLYKDLHSALKEEDYNAALSAANKVLAKDGSETDAVIAKAVCYVNLGKYQEAVDVIKKKDLPELSFVKAYALYRANRTEEALAVVDSKGTGEEHWLHLKAQALFRLQRYGESADTYTKIVKEVDTAAVTDPEVMTNLYAAFTTAGKGAEALKAFPVDESLLDDCWELGSNVAGAMIETGDVTQAEETLKEARETCVRMASEGEDGAPSEAKLVQETSVLDLQLAYLNASRGRRAEAEERCRILSKAKLDDAVTHVVALNNALALRSEKDTVGAYKRLRANLTEATQAKLLPTQTLTLSVNKAILALRTHKVKEATAELASIPDEAKKHWTVALVQLAMKEAQGEDPEKGLRDLLSAVRKASDEEGEKRVALTLARRLITQNKHAEAIQVIESVKSIQDLPGTVATLVALYEKDSAGKGVEGALRVLEAALARPAVSEEAHAKLLRGAAMYRARAGQHKEAAAAYKRLLELGVLEGEERVAALAALVIETSWFDADAAEQLASSLPVSHLFDKVGEIVPEELEKAGLPRTIRSRVQADLAQGKEKRRVTDPKQRQKRRAKLREKYLKSLADKGKYDPKHPPPPPDPERWIPKSQRSYNRRGRKGRTKFTGAQGSGDGAQKDAARLDVAARVAAEGGGGSAAKAPPPNVGKRRGK